MEITLLIAFVGLAFGLDVFLAWMWLPIYFRYGVPLFWHSRRLVTSTKLADCVPALAQDFRQDLRPLIEFKALGPDECAFREQVFTSRQSGLSYLALMHGYIQLESETQQLTVIGFAQWYVIAVAMLVISGAVGVIKIGAINVQSIVLAAGIGLGIALIGYGIQVWRYTNVSHAVIKLLNSAS